MKKLVILAAIILCIGLICNFVPSVGKFFSAPNDMVEAVTTGIEIKQLDSMINGFKEKNDRWPTEEEYSELIVKNFEQDRNDSLTSDRLVDVWGQPYNYFRKGSGYVLISMGPDKKPGTTDDIILLRH